MATNIGYARRSGGQPAILQRSPDGAIEADSGGDIEQVEGDRLVAAPGVLVSTSVGKNIPGITKFLFMDYFAYAPDGTLYADNMPMSGLRSIPTDCLSHERSGLIAVARGTVQLADGNRPDLGAARERTEFKSARCRPPLQGSEAAGAKTPVGVARRCSHRVGMCGRNHRWPDRGAPDTAQAAVASTPTCLGFSAIGYNPVLDFAAGHLPKRVMAAGGDRPVSETG